MSAVAKENVQFAVIAFLSAAAPTGGGFIQRQDQHLPATKLSLAFESRKTRSCLLMMWRRSPAEHIAGHPVYMQLRIGKCIPKGREDCAYVCGRSVVVVVYFPATWAVADTLSPEEFSPQSQLSVQTLLRRLVQPPVCNHMQQQHLCAR